MRVRVGVTSRVEKIGVRVRARKIRVRKKKKIFVLLSVEKKLETWKE